MGTRTTIALAIILLMGFILRLYKIDSPIGDWHSWRQADTSAVTRNFVKYGLDMLHPRYDDLSNIQTGKDNPMGYRFVEFPIYNAVSYGAFQLTQLFGLSLEVTERLVSILASIASIYLVFAIVYQYSSNRAALASAFFMAVLPYNIYYSRVILPEPMLIATALGSLYSFIRFADSRRYSLLIVSIVLAAVSLLLKPTAAFFFVPLIYVVFKNGIKKHTLVGALLFGALAAIPLYLWRQWMLEFPEGIPAWSWLFNSDGIRFKGAFFYWLFAERLGKLILGYWGLVLFGLGIMSREKKGNDWFYHLWGISMLLYISVLATGNVKHDYYQTIVIPIIAIYLGRGIAYINNQAGKTLGLITSNALAAVSIILMISFSWYTLRTYYWINNQRMIEAGKAANELLPKDAKVIAPLGGDTAFLYQTGRAGWPIGFEIDDKITKGAHYYISLDPPDPEPVMLMERYGYVLKTDTYAIIKLQ